MKAFPSFPPAVATRNQRAETEMVRHRLKHLWHMCYYHHSCCDHCHNAMYRGVSCVCVFTTDCKIWIPQGHTAWGSSTVGWSEGNSRIPWSVESATVLEKLQNRLGQFSSFMMNSKTSSYMQNGHNAGRKHPKLWSKTPATGPPSKHHMPPAIFGFNLSWSCGFCLHNSEESPQSPFHSWAPRFTVENKKSWSLDLVIPRWYGAVAIPEFHETAVSLL